MSNPRYDLAEALMRAVRRRRLDRINEPVPDAGHLADLPEDEQRNWLDIADAVMDIPGGMPSPTARIRELCDDFDRYTRTFLHDEEWREEMRRGALREMVGEVDRLTALPRQASSYRTSDG